MKFKNIFKVFKIICLYIIILCSMASCGKQFLLTSVTEQQNFDIETFNNENFKTYKIADVVIMAYINSTDLEYGDFSKYNLNYVAFKDKSSNTDIYINSIDIINTNKNYSIEKVENLNHKVDFKNVNGNDTVSIGREVLIDAINNGELKVNKNYNLKVVMNVTAINDDETNTEDLEYFFESEEISSLDLFFSR